MATHPGVLAATNAAPSSFACLFSHQSRRRSTACGHVRRHSVRPIVTCGVGSDDLLRSLDRVERRDLVLGGLGGLAGLGLDRAAALASPIAPPDLSKCHAASVADDDTNPTSTRTVECCPPFSDQTIDFTPPTVTNVRTRPAAHLVDDAYIQRFEKAIKLMKNLPGDDPRNFYQQANVHCAYCNDAYDQQLPDAKQNQLYIQVHACWLFFPWHRMYLHFFERILVKLLKDAGDSGADDFAIPFWNWDHPNGMQMPAMYNNSKSSLFDPNRNQGHLPPTTIILDYTTSDALPADKERQILENLSIMHRTMITNGKTPELFMGDRFVTGMKPNPGAGSLETTPHNNVHVWSGNPKSTYMEDMGNFYSAGRDCLFYAHHANVDRMWSVWNDPLNHANFTDDEWRDAAFYFYDENKQLVKVKVSDVFNTETLGYKYQDRDLPWRYTPPARSLFLKAEEIREKAAKTTAEFPLTLSTTVCTVVTRPKKGRSDKEKAAEEEVLVIKDIELQPSEYARFDVFVNAPDPTGLTPTSAEFAGSFSNVPHKKKDDAKGIKPIITNLRLGLTELLKAIDAEGDDSIVVTLVPRKGTVKIGGVGITYFKIK